MPPTIARRCNGDRSPPALARGSGGSVVHAGDGANTVSVGALSVAKGMVIAYTHTTPLNKTA